MQRGKPTHGGYPEPAVTFTPHVVRPGDVLVIATTRRLDMETAVRIRDQIRQSAPALADVVLLTDVTGLAAYRPDVETPGYVHRLLDAFLSGGVLNFGQEWVPEDVQLRLKAAVSSGILGTQAVRDGGS
jgi:hypothetical protein